MYIYAIQSDRILSVKKSLSLRWRTWHAHMLYIQEGDRYITTPDLTMAASFARPRNAYNCGLLRYSEAVVASSFQPNPHLDLSPSQC